MLRLGFVFCLVSFIPRVHVFAQSSEGYTLFGPLQGTDVQLIDATGGVVNKWTTNLLPGASAYLLKDGSLLRAGKITTNSTGGAGGRIERIAWDGTRLWKFDLATETALLHHDFTPLPNGNILMIVWDIRTAPEALAAGRDPALTHPAQVWGERIIEVRPTGDDGGEIVWEWRLWDHLIQDFDAAQQNFGAVAEHPELVDINYGASADASDWIHMNAIGYHPELDQIVVSSWYFNEIWIIDHSTTTEQAAAHGGGRWNHGGDLLYRWGNPAAYKTAGEQMLFGQHNAHWIDAGLPGEGHILIFNNRPGQGYSSVEEIETPRNEDGSYRREAGAAFGPERPAWRHEGNGSPAYYSQYFSSAQRLSNGNTLITAGGAGLILEVDPAGQEVWRYELPVEPGGVPTAIFRAYRYQASDAAMLANLPKPAVPVILNAASLSAETGLAPGALASAFGPDLAVSTEAAPSGTQPAQLAGSSVTVVDSQAKRWSAGLLFTAPEQVNFRIPDGAALGPAQVTIRNARGIERTAQVELRRVAPGLFTARADGGGPAAGYELPVSLNDPAPVYLHLVGTGLQFAAQASSMSVRIGGVEVPVATFTADPATPGLEHVVIGPIPPDLADREGVPLVFSADSVTANVPVVSFGPANE